MNRCEYRHNGLQCKADGTRLIQVGARCMWVCERHVGYLLSCDNWDAPVLVISSIGDPKRVPTRAARLAGISGDEINSLANRRPRMGYGSRKIENIWLPGDKR